MPKSPWKCLNVTPVYANPWVRLEEHLVRGPSGREFRHAVVHAGPSVLVVPVTDDGRLVITREYRYPTGGWNFELPGGGTGGLPARAAARKELKEETGYLARRLHPIGKFVVYCGLSSEFCHVFIATGLRRQAQELEHTEHIQVRTVTWQELERMIAASRFRDGMAMAALMMARPRLASLLGSQAASPEPRPQRPAPRQRPSGGG
jgi:8-oxo-dGTP pyrophosphatase MutT (NUDIX family)